MVSSLVDRRNRISGAIIRIRAHAPFFGVLAMHAEYVESQKVRTAATDGRTIYYNPDFIDQLTGPELLGIVLHEVLHCAYLHVTRMGDRHPIKWNIAADYVVNLMVSEVSGAALPHGSLYDTRFSGRRVEEVYDMLPDGDLKETLDSKWFDLPKSTTPNEGTGHGGAGRDDEIAFTPTYGQDGITHEAYWRNAVRGAVLAHKASPEAGQLPEGAKLLVDEIAEPLVNWRDLLRDFTVHHPYDFGEYDLRLISRGIYEERLEGERLRLSVCVDTSGSCLSWAPQFLGELRSLMDAFPHVSARLFYADAALYGPYEIEDVRALPPPRGGGGTDFRPFFNHVASVDAGADHQVLIYVTDGYGTFPAIPPYVETVWVVTPGGLELGKFPFGHTIMIGSN